MTGVSLSRGRRREICHLLKSGIGRFSPSRKNMGYGVRQTVCMDKSATREKIIKESILIN